MIKKVKMLKNKIGKDLKKKKMEAFTLLEMLVVLLIIGVLILLFVPNLMKHRETISKTEKEAITKVVETQVELYRLENNITSESINIQDLEGDYLTQEQIDSYNK